MARPIAETPILTGEDATRFERLRVEVEGLSREQRARNTQRLMEAAGRARKYITVRI